MKKSELKTLLKPLIKECIKESILEEGILSNVIMEVTKGLNTAPIVEQRKKPEAPKPTPAPTRTVNQTLVERKKKLMSAIGSDAYGGIDLFEGTTPAPGQAFGAQAASPMSGTDPNDAGIDISDIVALGGKKWKAFTG
tara:strand:+ start:818 stop:1231 length:414 start_codon:yes stop_codon:yes gene_type:complete